MSRRQGSGVVGSGWWQMGVLAHLGIALVLLGGAGCSLDKPYPDKSLHTIAPGAPTETSGTPGKAVLRVEMVRVARPFDGTTFVYKLGPSAFKTDYYNGFITTPDRILGGELTYWLAQSGLFASVVDGGSSADYQLSLESQVTALYGDYSEVKQPTAVIAMRFFIIDQRNGRYRVAFDKTYREQETLTGTKPEDLVEGWGKAYRRILGNLVNDLRQPPLAELANIEPW